MIFRSKFAISIYYVWRSDGSEWVSFFKNWKDAHKHHLKHLEFLVELEGISFKCPDKSFVYILPN